MLEDIRGMKSAVMDSLCSAITFLDVASSFFSFSLNFIPVLILETQLKDTASDNCDSPLLHFSNGYDFLLH
jgi:hypothetical protein